MLFDYLIKIRDLLIKARVRPLRGPGDVGWATITGMDVDGGY